MDTSELTTRPGVAEQMYDECRDPVFWVQNGIIVKANRQASILLGFAPDAFLAMPLSTIFRDSEFELFEKRQEPPFGRIQEVELCRRDGSFLPVAITQTIHNHFGAETTCVIARDITEQRELRRRLDASEAKLRQQQQHAALATDGGRVATFEWTLTLDVAVVSDSLYRLFGREIGSVSPSYQSFASHVFRSDLSRLNRVLGLAKRSGRAISEEFRIIWPDGTSHWLEIRAQFSTHEIGTPAQLHGVMIDIDEKKETLRDLRQSQESLGMALTAGKMSTYRWDAESETLHWSQDGFATTKGAPFSKTEINTKEWMAQVHPDDRGRVMQMIAAARRSRSECTVEYRLRHIDGCYRWLESRGRFVDNQCGNPGDMCGVVTNIDHRKRADKELRLRRFAVDAAAEAMITLTPDGQIIDVNQTVCTRLGYTCDELLRMNVSQIYATVSPHSFSDHVAMLGEESVLSSGARHRRKDGSLIDVEVSARLFEYDGREYICAAFRDVSELKLSEEKQRSLQQQLAHMNRIGSLGEMASTIAHELNQPLCVITNLASLLHDSTSRNQLTPESTEEITKTICSQSMLAAEIVRQMRSYCLNKEPTRQTVNLQELVQQSVVLLDPELRHSRIRTRVVCDDLPDLLIDRVQIQQVLVNLAHNAIEAMCDTDLKNRHLTIRVRGMSHDQVRLSVTDCGEGLSDDRQKLLFEPFASTKPNGMGMGLAISRSIVEAHGGQLGFECSADVGTTFHVDLPVVGLNPVT